MTFLDTNAQTEELGWETNTFGFCKASTTTDHSSHFMTIISNNISQSSTEKGRNKHGSSYHKSGIFYRQRVTLKACNQVLHTFSLLLNTSKQYCKLPPNFLSQLSKRSPNFLEKFQIRFCICEIHMLNMKSLKIYFRFYEVLFIQ